MKVGDKVRVEAWGVAPARRRSGHNWANFPPDWVNRHKGMVGEVQRIDDDGDPYILLDGGERFFWPHEHVRVIDDEGEGRAAAAPVPTEWVALAGSAPHGTCFGVSCSGHGCPLRFCSCECALGYDAAGHRYEIRWPSGVVGEGRPEFRRVEEAPLLQALFGEAALLERAEPQGDWCPACDAHLPADLVCAIEKGRHDCPSCGWRKGRCAERSWPSGKLCNGLLARSWNTQRGEAEMTCIKCGAVEE